MNYRYDYNLSIYNDEKTALFIDGANLYATARALEFDIDYRKMLNMFKNRCRLVRAYYYTALVEDENFSPIRPLVDWLDYNGYTMVVKNAKVYPDNNNPEKRRVRAHIDMECAIDMMELSDQIDHAILFSGDGDFHRLITAVQRKGVRVSVVSTVKTTPMMIADELRRQADNFIDLADIAKYIGREQRDALREVGRDNGRDNGREAGYERHYDRNTPADAGAGRDYNDEPYQKPNRKPRDTRDYGNKRITTIHGEDDY